jgi:hypothetical protein
MPKRISKKPRDANQLAAAVVAIATSEEPQMDSDTISRVMAELGRRGGKIGGKRRLETMTSKRRKQVAKKAANARWHPPKK